MRRRLPMQIEIGRVGQSFRGNAEVPIKTVFGDEVLTGRLQWTAFWTEQTSRDFRVNFPSTLIRVLEKGRF